MSSFTYKVTQSYNWFNNATTIVRMYFLNHIPFTFDELPEIARNLPEVTETANGNKRWSSEEMYKASMYLMAEECHPMLFELEIENPELLPVD